MKVFTATSFYYSQQTNLFKTKNFKGTVSIISTDLPFIEWHLRFTTIPFKPLIDQGFVDILIYIAKKPRKCTLALIP